MHDINIYYEIGKSIWNLNPEPCAFKAKALPPANAPFSRYFKLKTAVNGDQCPMCPKVTFDTRRV